MAEFSDDTLRGAKEIAKFLFGDEKYHRRVFYLADRKRLPVYRFAAGLYVRKSTLLAYIEEQEKRNRSV